ncbi:MAG: hemerythrin domain-containing protein [Nitrospinota bacterium]|nr:hemerythrin domain-containing protein [Nitrospinota bacterium]
MFKRIEKLEKEHEMIIQTLSSARSLGITSREARKKLLEAKSVLLEHLQNEDTYLYPVLKKASVNDEKLKTLISESAAEIDDVAGMATRFFEKCENNISDEQYIDDFKELFKTLLYRIHNEENSIYAEYNRIIS